MVRVPLVRITPWCLDSAAHLDGATPPAAASGLGARVSLSSDIRRNRGDLDLGVLEACDKNGLAPSESQVTCKTWHRQPYYSSVLAHSYLDDRQQPQARPLNRVWSDCASHPGHAPTGAASSSSATDEPSPHRGGCVTRWRGVSLPASLRATTL
ncbi:linoleate diol synthase [Marssonina coronariae]|uniref:Linoleate diol synthase n=1 Tax=Diplocarpon coronariae TaxID=2795749 RepID=A0A218YY59_9HELO|nr:linoleate diol synthase [Marssonina coronariae]